MNRLIIIVLLCLSSSALIFAKTSPLEAKLQKTKSEGISFVEAPLFEVDAELGKRNPYQNELRQAQYFQLDVQQLRKTMQSNPEAIRLCLPMSNKKTMTLEMVRHEVIDADFKLTTDKSMGHDIGYASGFY